MINADKPQRWKADIVKSVDMFNEWFLMFAPKAFRDTRVEVTEEVRDSLKRTNNLRNLSPATLREHPDTLRTLRMSTCPPLARDRLAGLARATRSVIGSLEKGKLPPRMSDVDLQRQLAGICKTISTMLDTDIFPWLEKHGSPTQQEQYRASTIVADRLCGAVSDPIIRNAQERRQLACIQRYLKRKGYKLLPHPPSTPTQHTHPADEARDV